MKRLALVVVAALLLTGCAGSFYAVHSAMIESTAAYKACLATSNDCERERKIHEIDLAAYRAMVAGMPTMVLPLPSFAPPPAPPPFRFGMCTTSPGLGGTTTTYCY